MQELRAHTCSVVEGLELGAPAGIIGGLLRLSVGLDDAEDLWDDLACGLAAAHVRAAA